jgi:hypothetical protein
MHAFFKEAQVQKSFRRPLNDHLPHMDLAEIILLMTVVVVGSVALTIGFDWIYRVLLS